MKKIRFVVVVRNYFDKLYGNSYIGGRVIDLDSGTWKTIPFQYGHGEEFAMSCGAEALGMDRNALNWMNTLVEEVEVSTQKVAKRYEKLKGEVRTL